MLRSTLEAVTAEILTSATLFSASIGERLRVIVDSARSLSLSFSPSVSPVSFKDSLVNMKEPRGELCFSSEGHHSTRTEGG